MITIVDYGMGNLGSIQNMLRKIGVGTRITADPAEIRIAEKLIIPGVGAFDAGMRNLREIGLLEALTECATGRRIPVLGICLGMQLMTRSSEEGNAPGLGWINADTKRFDLSAFGSLKVPHMGWRSVEVVRGSPLLDDLRDEWRFYFVHSYHVQCVDRQDVLLRARYGIDFDAAIQHENLLGVQFHPEKSHKFGLQLLKNFAERF